MAVNYMHTFLYHMYILGHVRGRMYYTWIFQVCKVCAFLPQKHTILHIWKIQVYIYMIDILIYLDDFDD